MMRSIVIGMALVILFFASGLPAAAQNPAPPSIDLQQELKRKRPVVAPVPDPAGAAKDADAAARRLDEQRRAEELQRKATAPSLSPALDESAVQGIQGRRLQEMGK